MSTSTVKPGRVNKDKSSAGPKIFRRFEWGIKSLGKRSARLITVANLCLIIFQIIVDKLFVTTISDLWRGCKLMVNTHCALSDTGKAHDAIAALA